MNIQISFPSYLPQTAEPKCWHNTSSTLLTVVQWPLGNMTRLLVMTGREKVKLACKEMTKAGRKKRLDTCMSWDLIRSLILYFTPIFLSSNIPQFSDTPIGVRDRGGGCNFLSSDVLAAMWQNILIFELRYAEAPLYEQTSPIFRQEVLWYVISVIIIPKKVSNILQEIKIWRVHIRAKGISPPTNNAYTPIDTPMF